MLNEFRSTYITWDKATSRIYSPVTANASDENGRKLVVQIVNSGQVEDLTGTTLHLYWETRDKLHDGLDVFKAVDLKKGEFELSYTTGMLSNQGVLNANLVLIDTVGRVVSERFKITVTEGIDNDAIQSENSFTTLTQALIDISNLEQNYAPRLNNLTAQLQQTEQSLNAQLAHKVGNGRKAELEDLSPVVLSAIEGGEGTSFNLLSVPQDKSVTPDKTTFIKHSTNLFNINDITLGKVIDYTGAITDNSTHGYSHPISVMPGESIYVVGVAHVAFYDNTNIFIQRIKATVSGDFITVPNNSYIARVSFNTGSQYWGEGVVQVSKSNTPVPYETYRETLIGVDVGEEGVRNHSIPDNEVEGRKLKKGTVEGSILIDDSISEKKVRFIKKSTNLFDKTKETKNVAISIDGTVVSNLDYNTSDFIDVTNSRTISSKVFYTLSFYDTNKNFLVRKSISTSTDSTQTDIPDKAVYVRGAYPHTLSIASQAQMNGGDVLLPYEEHYTELKDVKLSSQHKNSFLAEINNAEKRIFVDVPLTTNYELTESLSGKWGYSGVTSTLEVYAKYDELMAQHPDYITKELLGMDDFGNELYLYKFTPNKPVSDFDKHTAKYFLTTGIHGSEIVTPYGLWLAMEQICNNWDSDTTLEALRFNVEFLIIPVLCPTGFEDLTRLNRNGVDINRNFPYKWRKGTLGDVAYGGEEPLSEPETRYAVEVFENNPDIDVFVDFHNYGTTENDDIIWISSGIPIISSLGQNLITYSTRKWRKEYDFFPNDNTYFAGYTSGGQTMPTIRTYAESLGICLSTTLETSNRISLDPNGIGLDETHTKMVVETYINWFLLNLKELVAHNRTSL